MKTVFLKVEVPDTFQQFTHGTMEIVDVFGKLHHPQFTEITLPTNEEKEKAMIQAIHDNPERAEGRYVLDAIKLYDKWYKYQILKT